MASDYEPDFGAEPPKGYRWLAERKIIGYEDSPLDPWYYVKKADAFDVNERWPKGADALGAAGLLRPGATRDEGRPAGRAPA